MAKAIFEQGRPLARTIVSKNVKRLGSTGLPFEPGIRDVRFQTNDDGSENAVVGLKYHRGYTPEQMKEVNDESRMPTDGSARSLRFSEPSRETAKAKEAIARSALRPSKFPAMTMGATLQVKTGSTRLRSDTAGSYSPLDTARHGWIQLAPDIADEVAIHEIGHHLDHYNPRRKSPISSSGVSLYDESAESGIAEGRADVTLRENFRPDPRKPIEMKDANIYGLQTAVALDHHPKYLEGGLPDSNEITTGRQFTNVMRAKQLAFADGYKSTGAMPQNGHPYWKYWHDKLTSDPGAARDAERRYNVPIEDILGSLKARM